MTIQKFPLSPEGEAAAAAVSGPKHVWYSDATIVVYTDADYDALQPKLSQDEKDALDARSYAKLRALMQMTPAQVQAWVAANVTTLAQAQDAIATLAVAVSVLGRRI